MLIEIKSWFDGKVLFSAEAETLKDALEAAVKVGTVLDGARLDGASLDGARLDGASLVGARLVGASLDGARLDGARLDGASLVGASLDGARLVGASLDGASLDGARLVGASLDGARLDGARLVGARLDGARLDGASLDGARLVGASLVGVLLARIKFDFFGRCLALAAEVPGLRLALIEGRVDGKCYEGECSCFMGTAANVAHCVYTDFINIKPDSGSNTEAFFTGIAKGDTPETNPISRIVVGWTDEFAALLANAKNTVDALANAE